MTQLHAALNNSLRCRLPGCAWVWRYTLLTLFFTATLFAQGIIPTDGSRQPYERNADSLSILSAQLSAEGHFEESDRLAFEALTLSRQIGYKRGVGNGYINIGTSFMYQGRYTESIDFLKKGLEVYEEIKDSLGILNSLVTLGGSYGEKGSFSLALDCYFRALAQSETLRDTLAEAQVLNNIANIYSEEKRHHKAIVYYIQSLHLLTHLGQKREMAVTQVNLADAYHQHGNADSALFYLDQAQIIRDELKDKRGLANIAIGKAEIFLERRALSQASRLFSNALAQLEEFDAPRLKCYALLGLSKTHAQQQLNESAIKHASEAYRIANDMQSYIELKEAAKLLGDLYERRGNVAEALNFQKKFSQYKDSLFSIETLRATESLREQYETERKEREIAELSRIKSDQALRLADQKNRMNLITAGVVILFFLAIGLLILSVLKQRSETAIKLKNEALAQALKEKEEQRLVAETQRKIAFEAVAFKDDLIKIAAHDLKNPLQSVMGYSDLLIEQCAEESSLKSNQKEMIRRINSASERMLDLISSMLDNAPAVSEFTLKPDVIDVKTLMNQVLELNDYQFTRKEISYFLTVHHDCRIYADPGMLREIFDNVISNAIKYSPMRKKVFITVSHLYRHETVADDPYSGEIIQCDAENGDILIRIEDEGKGLTEEDMKNLFGRFQRLSAKPTAGESSSGLGLYVVKRMVELNGGKIWATSKGVDIGSIFYIQLPCRTPISSGDWVSDSV